MQFKQRKVGMSNKQKVDIIVPVYYSPELTLRTIRSVLANTDFSVADIEVVVVDDSANTSFNSCLKYGLQKIDPEGKVKLVVHEKNKGFIEACYTGIGYRQSDYKLLLNSDTFVMSGWLSEMLRSAQADEKIALVNPSTNNFPVIETKMPAGWNNNMQHRFFQSLELDGSEYLDIVTAGGFCLLIKSDYIEKYGFFDRIYGKGYCEETDLHFRYITQGLRAVIAPKAYVYHRGEGSFSDTDERFKNNFQILMSRYKDVFAGTRPVFEAKTSINSYRAQQAAAKSLDADVLVISPTNFMKNGGVKVLHSITNALNEFGLSTVFSYNFDEARGDSGIMDKMYEPISFDKLFDYDFCPKVILYSLDSNAYQAGKFAAHVEEKYGSLPVVVNILQDVEGWFWGRDTGRSASYIKLADKHFAVSEFVADAVANIAPQIGEAEVITNPVSLDFYGNSLKVRSAAAEGSAANNVGSKPKRQPIITAMLRKDEKRGATIIAEALDLLDKKLTQKVTFHYFGDFSFSRNWHNIKQVAHGYIDEASVTNLLATSDIFLEASYYQGYGLTAMEALLAGNTVFSSNNSGASSVLPDSPKLNWFQIGSSQDLAEKLTSHLSADVPATEPLSLAQIYSFSFLERYPIYVDYFKALITTKPSTERRARFYKAYGEVLETIMEHTLENPFILYQKFDKTRIRYRALDKFLGLFGLK